MSTQGPPSQEQKPKVKAKVTKWQDKSSQVRSTEVGNKGDLDIEPLVNKPDNTLPPSNIKPDNTLPPVSETPKPEPKK